MRPVTRAENDKTYSKYQDAIGDLEESFDNCCSYCERRLPVGLAVEHVSPKCLDEDQENSWENFLLGCPNCNSVKGKKPTNDHEFFWPDRDNTMRAIAYTTGGLVEAEPGLSGDMHRRAVNLIDLVGLDRHPGQPPERQPADRDKRYEQREKVWRLAESKRRKLPENDTDEYRSTLAELASAKGFFSVWMTVFSHESDMRRRFIAAFKGTAEECFDRTNGYALLARSSGQL